MAVQSVCHLQFFCLFSCYMLNQNSPQTQLDCKQTVQLRLIWNFTCTNLNRVGVDCVIKTHFTLCLFNIVIILEELIEQEYLLTVELKFVLTPFFPSHGLTWRQIFTFKLCNMLILLYKALKRALFESVALFRGYSSARTVWTPQKIEMLACVWRQCRRRE